MIERQDSSVDRFRKHSFLRSHLSFFLLRREHTEFYPIPAQNENESAASVERDLSADCLFVSGGATNRTKRLSSVTRRFRASIRRLHIDYIGTLLHRYPNIRAILLHRYSATQLDRSAICQLRFQLGYPKTQLKTYALYTAPPNPCGTDLNSSGAWP